MGLGQGRGRLDGPPQVGRVHGIDGRGAEPSGQRGRLCVALGVEAGISRFRAPGDDVGRAAVTDEQELAGIAGSPQEGRLRHPRGRPRPRRPSAHPTVSAGPSPGRRDRSPALHRVARVPPARNGMEGGAPELLARVLHTLVRLLAVAVGLPRCHLWSRGPPRPRAPPRWSRAGSSTSRRSTGSGSGTPWPGSRSPSPPRPVKPWATRPRTTRAPTRSRYRGRATSW